MFRFVLYASALCVASVHGLRTPWPIVRSEIQNAMTSTVQAVSSSMANTMIQMTVVTDEHDPIQAVAGWSQMNARQALPNDTTLIGSATKSITAAAIMQLVDAGKLGLDEKVAPIVDSHFATVNMSLLQYCDNDERVENVTVRHLLQMGSGVPDFDTPALREWQWENPTLTNTPFMIMASLKAKLYYEPGAFRSYSSTNYVLLGFILMVKAGDASWDQYSQGSVLPRRPGVEYKFTEFCLEGTLASHDSQVMNVTHGYGPTWRDWYNVSATSGWACGNGLSNSLDLAMFFWDLFNYNIVSKETIGVMKVMSPIYEFPIYYGLGIMSMIPDPLHQTGVGLGHGGDTYGYYALPAYNIKHNYSVAATTNWEAGTQAGLSVALGTVYNAVAEILVQNGY